MSRVSSAHYGKARIPIMRIDRLGQQHQVYQAVVGVDMEGDQVVAAYTTGDNSGIVATDTMKNLVYALVRDYAVQSNEGLARHLARTLHQRYPAMRRVTITVEELAWERLAVAESPNPVAFRRAGAEQFWATATSDGEARSLEAGIRGLVLLKTSESAFAGFVRDEFTTLPEAEDRVLATDLSGSWSIADDDLDYRSINCRLRAVLVDVFVRLYSRSVQELAYQMASAVLEACPPIAAISLRLPNLHCNLVDLSPFGMSNDDVVYLPTEAPHGDLYVTVSR